MNQEREIKCVVWDLDATLWDGILLEGDDVHLKPGIETVIQTLDSRGILHSVASKNDYETAMSKLAEFGLREYFLYPQIAWCAKSRAIGRILESLNIRADSLLFIDDQPTERDEVKSEYPEVLCMDSAEYESLLAHPRLNPRHITEDSARRRSMYLEQMERCRVKEDFQGPRGEFLASLNMHLAIARAEVHDLKRAEELTARTNQLNTTGRTYDYDALKSLLSSPSHELLMCELRDKYGFYGKIGLALIEDMSNCLMLRLFLMSCRVMTLGVGTVFLSHIMQRAREKGKTLRADFRHNGKNKPMYITLKMANFAQVEVDAEGDVVLENDLTLIQRFPPYLEVSVTDCRENRT